jgi:hypothetical protein
MTALDQQVGARHHTAIGSGQYSAVIPYANDTCRVGRQYGSDGRYQAELAEICNGNRGVLADRLVTYDGAPLR